MVHDSKFKELEYYGFGPNVMRKTKTCSKCGQVVRSGSFFCPACGEKLPRETLFEHYKKRHICCPDCDTVLSLGSQYCPNCGRQIVKKTAKQELGDVMK